MEKTFVGIRSGDEVVCFENRFEAISFAQKLRRLVERVSLYEEDELNGTLKLLLEF